jgi:Tfp pilus assembly protein PilN
MAMYARFAVMVGIALLFGAGTLLVGSRWSAMQTRKPVAENGEAAQLANKNLPIAHRQVRPS